MKKTLLSLILIAIGFSQCSDDNGSGCTTLATVRDLTGFDGCGFVFELEDGSKLEPVIPFLECGTPPLPKEITEDPLFGFEFVAGKRVRIAYEQTGSPSICMVGPVVKITCIEELPLPNED